MWAVTETIARRAAIIAMVTATILSNGSLACSAPSLSSSLTDMFLPYQSLLAAQGALRPGLESGIVALKEQQWTAFMDGRGNGLAHQNPMIAGVESLHRAALDGGQYLVEQRRSGDAWTPGNAVEAALLAPDEVNGE